MVTKTVKWQNRPPQRYIRTKNRKNMRKPISPTMMI